MGGHVVSTVDGVPITVADIERVVAATGVAPQRALSMLQEQELLAGAAESAGYGDGDSVARAGQQATVQALLRGIEANVTAEQISEEQLRQGYERFQSSFTNPELRAVTYALCPASSLATAPVLAEAHACAERALVELTEADDVERAFDVLSGRRVGEAEVSVGSMPAFGRDAEAEPAFVDAVFATDRLGPLAEPVRISQGFVALVVTEVRAAREASLEEAAPDLTERFVNSERFDRVAGLVGELSERHGVERDATAVEWVLTRSFEP